jgi:hypothetical protein
MSRLGTTGTRSKRNDRHANNEQPKACGPNSARLADFGAARSWRDPGIRDTRLDAKSCRSARMRTCTYHPAPATVAPARHPSPSPRVDAAHPLRNPPVDRPPRRSPTSRNQSSRSEMNHVGASFSKQSQTFRRLVSGTTCDPCLRAGHEKIGAGAEVNWSGRRRHNPVRPDPMIFRE